MKFNLSLRARLLLLVLLASVPPLGLMLYAAVETRDTAVLIARENLLTIGKLAALDFQKPVEGAKQLLTALAQVPAIAAMEPQGCTALLADLLKRYVRYGNLYVADRSGNVLCSGTPLARAVNFSDRDYFQAALKSRESVVGRAVVGRIVGRPVLPLAYPLTDARGEVTGVVAATLDLAWFAQGIWGSHVLPGMVVVLWNDEARIMTRYPSPEKWSGRTFATAQAAHFKEANSAETAGMDGVTRIYASYRLTAPNEPGLWLSVGIGKDQLLAGIDRVFVRNIALLGIFALAAIAGAWLLGDALIRRHIAKLSHVTQQVSQGNYGARIGGPYSKNELGELARSFDQMGASLERALREAKRAEQEVRSLNEELEERVASRTAQLEAANKELEAFSYSVSHDLRAPLRAIDGFSRILEEDYGGRLDQEGRRLLQVVRENSRKMAQLIDDLLVFSRTGRKPIAAAEIDMNEMVREVLQELGVAPAGPPAVLIHCLPPAWGDRALLRQVWANLISNAIKFSSKKKEPRIEIGGSSGAKENTYYVRDNGTGFDMRYYDKLFGVFQRLHAPDDFPGTGVGLAIVQRVVVRHAGRVWAEAQSGAGATFFFSLPAPPQASDGNTPATPK